MSAAALVLSAFVASEDTQRRLQHMARLAELNGHDDTSETMLLLAELGAATTEEVDE